MLAYRIISAGYNICHTRDEFRVLWKKISGRVRWPPTSRIPIRTVHVGIGFCSHLPGSVDTAVLSEVVLENAAGKAR